MSMFTANFHNSYEDMLLGLVDRELFVDTTRQQLRLLTTPGGRGYWKNFNTGYARGFIDYVDRRLVAQE